MRLLQQSTVSQSCLLDCPDFAERMKRKALRVRSEGSIPPYVTEAESRKQHSDSPLCNSHNRYRSSGGELAEGGANAVAPDQSIVRQAQMIVVSEDEQSLIKPRCGAIHNWVHLQLRPTKVYATTGA